MHFKEEFLHFIWQKQAFDHHELKTTDGDALVIKNQGRLNAHSGPDFLHSEITHKGQNWHGHIEIHKKSSDWYAHGHHEDPAYDPVVLHVVYEHDLPAEDALSQKVPHLELRGLIPLSYYRNYERFFQQLKSHPCHSQLSGVNELSIHMWLQRMAVEKMESKKRQIDGFLDQFKGDWNQVCFVVLARYFGMKVNNDGFEHLARAIPANMLHRLGGNRLAVEALLYGRAGMLKGQFRDEYPRQLKKEYTHLKKKYGLPEMHPVEWKFMRMRPANFPTIRISQLADLMCRGEHPFSQLIQLSSLSEMRAYLQVEASPYWKEHYVFDRDTENSRTKKSGRAFLDNLIINAVLPLMFSFAKTKGNHELMDRVFYFFESLKPESNALIRKWDKAGFKSRNAADSQALLHLNEHYCKPLRCLHCAIGYKLMGQKEKEV